MNDVEITTIIPTYRRPELLRRAVASVQSQSYTNVRICIYDNASGDETETVANELVKRDGRISYIQRETNIGAINNMVDAGERVQSPLYSFLNDDDLLLPGFYQAAADSLSQHSAAKIAFARTVAIDVDQCRWFILNQGWKPGYYEPSIDVAAQMAQSHFVQTAVLMRREVRDVIGPFEPSGDDRIQGVLAAATLPFVVLGCVGAAYTMHGETISSTGGPRSGPQDDVFKSLVLLSKRILSLDACDTTKGYLLQFVNNAYGDSFRMRRLDSAIGRRDSGIGAAESLLPNVDWRAARRLTSIGRRNSITRPLMTTYLKTSLAASERRRRKRIARKWNPLPGDVRSCLNGETGLHAAISDMVAQT